MSTTEAETRTILHLGAGQRPTPGAVNHDLRLIPGIDVAHDLELTPWPWETAAFDQVLAIDLLEHLDRFLPAMEEIHRVLKPGGELVVQMPYFGSVCHATDPTHRRGCTEHTFGYFDARHPHCQHYPHYSSARFELKRFGHEVPGGDFWWNTTLTLPNDWPTWIIERRVGGNLVFELRRA